MFLALGMFSFVHSQIICSFFYILYTNQYTKPALNEAFNIFMSDAVYVSLIRVIIVVVAC